MKVVRIGPNKGYVLPKDPEAARAAKAIWEKVKGELPKTLPLTTAMENVKLSGGMYAILPDVVAPAATAVLMPEEMSADALKLTALQLGVDLSKKPMKKADLVKAVRNAMEAVQILDDDEGDEA